MAKKIELYYRDFCGFCARVETILQSKGLEYERIDIWADAANKEQMVARTKGKTTVPQVFADGAYIGDSSKLAELDRQGKLDDLLGL